MVEQKDRKPISLKVVVGLLVFLILLQAFGFIYFYFQQKKLICALGDAFYAERQYVYPILRDLGYDPDNYGKDYFNPITITALGDCELNNDWRY